MARCEVCFRHCEIEEGKYGFCMARKCENGKVAAANYGEVTGIALDPIEKKPLYHFYPGSVILSVGSYGCNLRCPFCQNDDISWGDAVLSQRNLCRYLTPEELCNIALSYKNLGNIGIAYTYNEPLTGYEYVRDCAKLAHDAGLKNVLVTNGTAELSVLDEILPYIDAMNIDLKGFTEKCYRTLGGNLEMTKAFITEAAKHCHVEITTLVVPGLNDSEEEIITISEWIADLKDKNGKTKGPDIPYHLSRFFPRFHMSDAHPTDVGLIYHLKDIALRQLHNVHTGNC